MLRRVLVFAGIAAVAAILSACSAEAAVTPASLELKTPASAGSSISTLPPANSSPMAETVRESLGTTSSGGATSGNGTAAGQNALDPSPPAGAVVAPTGATQPAATPLSRPADDITTISRMVVAYWGAFNDYDADIALSMLEPSYRAVEEELIRRDIGRMKLFRVKLDVSEETSISRNDAGDYEIHLRLATPVDTRRLLMVFRHIDGQWWIVFSDEVE